MMNYAFLVGRIADEPITRVIERDGERPRKVTTFALITHKWYRNKELTEGHDIEAWGDGLSTLFTQRLKKGDQVGFVGSIRHDAWKDDDGHWHNRTWVVLGPDAEISIGVRAKANRPNNGERA